MFIRNYHFSYALLAAAVEAGAVLRRREGLFLLCHLLPLIGFGRCGGEGRKLLLMELLVLFLLFLLLLPLLFLMLLVFMVATVF